MGQIRRSPSVSCQYRMPHQSTLFITADLDTRLRRHLRLSVQHHLTPILICQYQSVITVSHQDLLRDHRRHMACLLISNATRFLLKTCKPLTLTRHTCTLTCTQICASKALVPNRAVEFLVQLFLPDLSALAIFLSELKAEC